MPTSPSQKTVNLALQGGGSHGAFTWGVLDALLEDGRVDVEGVSATSAGAMNAVVLAHGKMNGGADGARKALETFWREVSNAGALYAPFQQSTFSQFLNPAQNAFVGMAEDMFSTFSPYQFNPLNMNPLKDILGDLVDFEKIRTCKDMKLFITATNVRSGTAHVFQNEEVTLDALMASACLPQLFQAVEIDGEAYWDGGYMGNPSLWPLFYHAKCRDILLVHINPITCEDVPKNIDEIENRLNEITFNTALLKELRAIDFVKKLINEDMLKDEYKDQYKDILFHAIRAEAVMSDFSASSKADTDWAFLKGLKEKGRASGQAWLDAHYDDIGHKTSVDIQDQYLSTP